MEISETMLIHLRDEAYACLVQQALKAELANLEAKQAEVATTRPRFGVLSGRKSRDEFDGSMRAAEDAVTAARDRLAQITGIGEWLHPVVRQDVSSYLASVSPDYCRLLQIRARLDDWERAYGQVPEAMVAFARDLREVRRAAEGGATTVAREVAGLRDSAERLARIQHELHIIEQAALMQAPAGIAERIRFPGLPNLQRVPWVGRLAVLRGATLVAEAAQVEKEFRAFPAGAGTEVAAQLKASRTVCAELASRALEDYWNVLRTHARQHYVEARGVDEVIAMLTEAYVDQDIRRRQEEVTAVPFAWR